MRTFVLILALALAGCQSTGVTVPRIPDWQAPIDSTHISALAVQSQVMALLPGVPVHTSDATYTRISHDWLEEFLRWEWEVQAALGVAYTPESFDCEDFSLGFAWAASRAAAKAGLKVAPLVARIVVLQSFNPPTRHSMIGVATDRGLFVVEPQPDAGPFRITPLSRFDRTILSVVLGDYNP